jgi:hypothetical protein
MTNHDFWMSISDIINEGFTSEGLAKLDDYAEQFSTGKILSLIPQHYSLTLFISA